MVTCTSPEISSQLAFVMGCEGVHEPTALIEALWAVGFWERESLF